MKLVFKLPLIPSHKQGSYGRGVARMFFKRWHKIFENVNHHGWPTKLMFGF